MIGGYPYFWKHPIGSFAHLLQVCVTYTFLTGHESKGWDAPIRYEWRNRSTGAHWNDHNVFEVGRSILEMKFLMRVQEKQQSPVLCEYWTSKWLTKHIQDLDFFGDWGQLSPRYTSYLHVKNSLLFCGGGAASIISKGKKAIVLYGWPVCFFLAMVPHWRNNLMILKTC